MAQINLVYNDTNTIQFEVKDQNGTAQSIVGATSITFQVRRRGTMPLLINRSCTITDGAGGICTYALVADDWNRLRPKQWYEGRLSVVFSDASRASTPQLYEIYVGEDFSP